MGVFSRGFCGACGDEIRGIRNSERGCRKTKVFEQLGDCFLVEGFGLAVSPL